MKTVHEVPWEDKEGSNAPVRITIFKESYSKVDTTKIVRSYLFKKELVFIFLIELTPHC